MNVEMATEISYLQPISRELAHRTAVAEVFVTSLAAAGAGADEFIVGAQLPRSHAYYGDHAGQLAERHDPLVVMEAARQAAIALTHEFYGVPTDQVFLVRTFNGAGADTAAWTVRNAPANLAMTVRVLRTHRRGDLPIGMDMVLDISCSGEPIMTVDGSFSWTSPRQWAGLRSEFRKGCGLGPFTAAIEPPARVEPVTVGRENYRNVVIGPVERSGSTARAEIAADTTHPFLFDHELDHVPGSLLLEAARQTGISLLRPEYPSLPTLVNVASAFDRFVELDRGAECIAVSEGIVGGRREVRCEIRQQDGVAAQVDLEFMVSEEVSDVSDVTEQT